MKPYLGAEGQEQFRQQMEQLNAAWDEVIASGEAPDSEPAQQMAARHVEWLVHVLTICTKN